MTKEEVKRETRLLVRSIDKMTKDLWKAVDEERYEQAAIFRDKIYSGTKK